MSNEAPLHEQWRLALISAASTVLGRRATGLTEDLMSDSGGGGGAGGGNTGGATPGSSTSAVGGSASSVSSSAGNVAGASGTGAFSTNLLQNIEAENASIMSIIIREWRRLPLIVTNQHVRLLQVFSLKLLNSVGFPAVIDQLFLLPIKMCNYALYP